MLSNDVLKNKIFYLYENKISLMKPKCGEFYISNIKFITINRQKVEGFQYSGVNKYIPFETLFKCYEQLYKTGFLTRIWFRTDFPFEHLTRPCNFTTIGSIFVKLGFAEYVNDGKYKKI